MRVLEAGRAQTIAITLSQLPEIPVIVDAINKLDNNRLTLTNIQALSKLYPTKDESKKIASVIKNRLDQIAKESKDGNNSTTVERLVWDKPESLFIALGKIPSCTLRLSCWSKFMYYIINCLLNSTKLFLTFFYVFLIG